MANVTGSQLLWSGIALTGTTTSVVLDVQAFREGRFFIDGDVTAGTSFTPKLQQKDPKKGTWFDRSETFTSMTPTGGPDSDGLNQTEIVSVSNLGSRMRMVITAAGSSPSMTVTVTFEGKT